MGEEDNNIKEHIKFGNVEMRLPHTSKAIALVRRLLDIFGEDLNETETGPDAVNETISNIGVEGNGSRPKIEAQDGEVKCPDCGSTHLWKQGSVRLAGGIKYKYSCQDCDRKFQSDIDRPRAGKNKVAVVDIPKEPKKPGSAAPLKSSDLLIPRFEWDPKAEKLYKKISFYEHEDGRVMVFYMNIRVFTTKQAMLSIPYPVPYGYEILSGFTGNRKTAIRIYREYLATQEQSKPEHIVIDIEKTSTTNEDITPVIKYTDGKEAKPEHFQPAGGPGKKNKDGTITVSDQYEFCLKCPHKPMEPKKESCKGCVHRQGELVKQFLRGSLGREPTEEEIQDAQDAATTAEKERIAKEAEDKRLWVLKEKAEVNKHRWSEKDEKDESEQKAPEPETVNVADVVNVSDASDIFIEAEKFDCSKIAKTQVGTSIICRHADGRIAIRQPNYKDVITTTDVWITTLKGLSKEALKETLKSLNGAKQWMLKKYLEDLKDEEIGAFGTVKTETRRQVGLNE
jgi:hypothetical protein